MDRDEVAAFFGVALPSEVRSHRSASGSLLRLTWRGLPVWSGLWRTVLRTPWKQSEPEQQRPDPEEGTRLDIEG